MPVLTGLCKINMLPEHSRSDIENRTICTSACYKWTVIDES
jgi:hypothetical protein